jgi:hypothetical protein
VNARKNFTYALELREENNIRALYGVCLVIIKLNKFQCVHKKRMKMYDWPIKPKIGFWQEKCVHLLYRQLTCYCRTKLKKEKKREQTCNFSNGLQQNSYHTINKIQNCGLYKNFWNNSIWRHFQVILLNNSSSNNKNDMRRIENKWMCRWDWPDIMFCWVFFDSGIEKRFLFSIRLPRTFSLIKILL